MTVASGWLSPCLSVFDRLVVPERWQQLRKWGRQSLPDGTGHVDDRWMATWYRSDCQLHDSDGTLTWRDVLREEFYEALTEIEPALLKAELVQVATVCLAWIEDIERRQE